MFNSIKNFIQRGIRGYSDEDLCDFQDYLCNIVPLAVRNLSKRTMGCPEELYDKDKVNDECHKWNVVLEEIAQGFEAAKALLDTNFTQFIPDPESRHLKWEVDEGRLKQLSEKYQRGLELFSKYFLDLWD